VLLEGRVALITGSGSGLGFAMAQQFIEQGAAVAVNDLHAHLAEEARRKLDALGHCLPVPGSIAIAKDVEQIVKQTVAHFGRLDVLINNAGISPAGLVKSQTVEDWQRAFETNLKGTLFTTQAAFPYLIDSAYGRVINISSEIAEHGMMYQSAYASTKAAVSALTKSLARTLGEHNVTVNAICPGVVPQTNLVKEFTQDRPEYADILKFYHDICPLPAKARPLDIAHVAVLLASDFASFLNGQMITVNGGSS
jgi:3-oxoacyl-[acyl-carrier protein] reductase